MTAVWLPHAAVGAKPPNMQDMSNWESSATSVHPKRGGGPLPRKCRQGLSVPTRKATVGLAYMDRRRANGGSRGARVGVLYT